MARTLTIKSKQFDCLYAGVGFKAMLKAQIFDKRPLSIIAPEVEGGNVIEYDDDDGDHKKFENYTKLMRMDRIDDDTVVIMLECTGTEVQDDD